MKRIIGGHGGAFFTAGMMIPCRKNAGGWWMNQEITRSVRLMETIEPGDKTAVPFTWVFNNDIVNKNTAVQFTWFQNSFETFETTSRGSF